MNLSVDRFEGNLVICEDKDRKLYAIEIGEMPSGVKPGDMITITNEGEIKIDEKLTKARKSKIRSMENKLWK